MFYIGDFAYLIIHVIELCNIMYIVSKQGANLQKESNTNIWSCLFIYNI